MGPLLKIHDQGKSRYAAVTGALLPKGPDVNPGILTLGGYTEITSAGRERTVRFAARLMFWE
ncbi:MAG: hypothetical protein M3Z09_03980 [Acidobacteriota bacterium]|nr:hypothetical protein [Acidobacteriota bacterium]